MSLYEILGIGINATTDEIRKAFRRKALVWHPDRNKTKEAERKFKELSEAYAVLVNDEKRKKYDEKIAPKKVDDFKRFFEEVMRTKVVVIEDGPNPFDQFRETMDRVEEVMDFFGRLFKPQKRKRRQR